MASNIKKVQREAEAAAATRAERDKQGDEKLAAAQLKRSQLPFDKLCKPDYASLNKFLKRDGDSPLATNKRNSVMQLQKRELRLAKEHQQAGQESLTKLDLRVLMQALWKPGDTSEEDMLSRDRKEMITELGSREARTPQRTPCEDEQEE